MALQRSSRVERVLLVLSETGVLRGAHQERIETITEDGAVIQVRQLAAEPLDAAALAGVLPGEATLLAQIGTLTAERDAAVAALSAAESRVSELEARLSPKDTDGLPILTAVQVRLALLGSGITIGMVDAIIDGMPAGVTRDTARTYWEYAIELHRDHALIGQLGAALGLTSEQIDTMWRQAASIT